MDNIAYTAPQVTDVQSILSNMPQLMEVEKPTTNLTESKLTSGELGILWSSYMTKTLFQQMFIRFAQTTTEPQAKRILDQYTAKNAVLIEAIKQIFENEKAIVPQGITSKDVYSDAPKLFDDEFYIIMLRFMAKTTLGFNAVDMSMAFREDVRGYYANALTFSQSIYNTCTEYLTNHGILARPPYVTMPKEVEFIEEAKYMSGIKLFGNKRALNSLELSYIFNIIESNLIGTQLMTGFAQVAKEKEVKNYFVKAKELAKKIVQDMSEICMQSDIQPPSTWAGKTTDSTVPPFSDKMMMYTANILTSFGLAGNAFGAAFSMRSDLPLTLAIIAKDTLDLAMDGGKLMIKHKWLEEPPQMEDRNTIIENTQ